MLEALLHFLDNHKAIIVAVKQVCKEAHFIDGSASERALQPAGANEYMPCNTPTRQHVRVLFHYTILAAS